MAKKKNTGIPTIKQLPSGSWHAKVYTHTDDKGKRHYKCNNCCWPYPDQLQSLQ